MAENFLTCDRDQPLLLPPDLRDWLPADHLAWFVIDSIDELDLEPSMPPIAPTATAEPPTSRR